MKIDDKVLEACARAIAIEQGYDPDDYAVDGRKDIKQWEAYTPIASTVITAYLKETQGQEEKYIKALRDIFELSVHPKILDIIKNTIEIPYTAQPFKGAPVSELTAMQLENIKNPKLPTPPKE